LRGGGGRLKSQ